MDSEVLPSAKWANLTSLVRSTNFTAKQLHFRVSENFTKFAFVATKAVLTKQKGQRVFQFYSLPGE